MPLKIERLIAESQECRSCSGTGYSARFVCGDCQGSGNSHQRDEVEDILYESRNDIVALVKAAEAFNASRSMNNMDERHVALMAKQDAWKAMREALANLLQLPEWGEDE